MKGLILSGGHGTRLRPFTYSQQKQLIPIANKPILFYCIEDLINAGITDIAIIVGPNREQVVSTVRSSDWNANISFIYQDEPRGLAHAVKIAHDFLGDEKFIMYLGDNILKGGSVNFVKGFENSDADASLMLAEVEDSSRYGVAQINEEKKVIVNLIEKPKVPPSNLSVVGIYGFTSVIFNAIDDISPSDRGELEITDAIYELIKRDYKVCYEMTTGWWKDTGENKDLLEVNRLILDGIDEGQVGEDTDIVDSTVDKHSIVGKDCILYNCRVGPYTSVGNGCVLTDVEIENSIVMDGACITNAGYIRDSIIGKDVQILKKTAIARTFVIGDRSVLII